MTVDAVVEQKKVMSLKRSRTQWTAQFLVAAELARRNFTVGFTMGNTTPMADLLVAHLQYDVQFLVNVKGMSSKTTWLVERPGKLTMENLYYILAYVGHERADDEFFILSQSEAKSKIQEYSKYRGGVGSLDKAGFQGFPYSWAKPYKDQWQKLPGLKGVVDQEEVLSKASPGFADRVTAKSGDFEVWDPETKMWKQIGKLEQKE